MLKGEVWARKLYFDQEKSYIHIYEKYKNEMRKKF